MFSLAYFRKNLYPIFRIVNDSCVVFMVVYRNKVYEVAITKTNQKPRLVRTRRKPKPRIHDIHTSLCKDCGSLIVNNICMNTKCVSNSFK